MVRSSILLASRPFTRNSSRTFVTPFHCNLSDPESLDKLATAYHTLLLSMLNTWPLKHTISPSGFVAFVKSVLNGLPSSSSGPPQVVSVFGEHLVDMIWAVDAELDEFLGEAKSMITNSGDNPAGKAALSKAQKDQQNAENDKLIITNIVKQLVVRPFFITVLMLDRHEQEFGLVVPSFCIERLDTTISASVGLIPDKPAFDKKEIRTRTGLLCVYYLSISLTLLTECQLQAKQV